MKVLSLNVNGFMGVNTKNVDVEIRDMIKCSQKYPDLCMKIFDKENRNQEAIDGIKSLIDKENPDIIILQEYRRNFPSAKAFERDMQNKGYAGPLTHQEESKYKFGFSTAIYIKEELKEKCVYKKENDLECKLSFVNCNDRVYSIGMNGFVIVGVHIPLNNSGRPKIREETWDEVIKYVGCECNSQKKIIFIGDFNTYDSNTAAYDKKQQMLDNNVEDIWLNSGNSELTPTQKPHMRRLDYVFTTVACAEHKINMRLIPDNDEEFIGSWNLSDHRAIVVEID